MGDVVGVVSSAICTQCENTVSRGASQRSPNLERALTSLGESRLGRFPPLRQSRSVPDKVVADEREHIGLDVARSVPVAVLVNTEHLQQLP